MHAANKSKRFVVSTKSKSKRATALLLFATCTVFGLAVYAGAALPPQTPDMQFGNFLFNVPNGWNPVEKDNNMYIVAPGMLPGGSTFIALASGDLDGDLQKSANELWAGFQKAYRILQGGHLTPMHSAGGYDAYYTTAIASDQNGVRWQIYFLGAQYGKHIEVVTLVSNLPPGVSYDAAFHVFQTFLAGLRFGDSLPGSNLPPTDQPPPISDAVQSAPPGMLQGVYVCTTTADARPANKQFVFYSDGIMMNGLPEEGMLNFDLAHYRNEDNRTGNWIGRYKVNGDQVKIVWQNQFGDPANPAVIRINNTLAHPALDLGWEIFIPMCRCTGKKLSGMYRWGLPAQDQYIQFFPDGTFLDHRTLDQILIVNAFFEHPRTQRGTYSIQNQTIIFNFADGHRGARTFLAPKVQENNPKFDWIDLGRKQLFEEEYRQKLAAQF